MKSTRSKTGFFGVCKDRLTGLFQARFRYKGACYKKRFYSVEEAAQWVDNKIEELGIREIMEARRDSYENKKEKAEKEYKHGAPGIKYNKKTNLWIAYITRNGKKITRESRSKEKAIEKYKLLLKLYPPKTKPLRLKKERKPLKTTEEMKARRKQANKERYKKNIEENRKKAREGAAKRRKENQEHVKTISRKHYEENKELYMARAAARRAKTKNPPIWCPEANKVYAKMRREAKRLEKLTAIVFEVDHIVPLNGCTTAMYRYTPLTSGLHCSDNFQLLTKLDNNSKNAYTWPDMWDYNDTDLIELQRIYETNIKHITN